MPGQVAHAEYKPQRKETRTGTIEGRRGRIVGLWQSWQKALAREGLGRLPGETVRDYSQRLSRSAPETGAPGRLPELLEMAHYSAEEPGAGDLEEMHTLVHAELSRQSLRRDAPMETPDQNE